MPVTQRYNGPVMQAGVLLLLALAPPVAAEAVVHPWEVFEVEMNAAAETLVLPDAAAARVVFTNQRSSISVPAFWDGGRTWRVRFAPPAAGDWEYRTESSDAGLKRTRGRLQCAAWSEEQLRANPARHGFVRAAGGGRHFEYADGTPFLWIGDTWWNWWKKGIHFETFRKLADHRAANGFSVGQLFFPGKGGLLDGRGEVPDFDQIRKVEAEIAYANSRGITVWIHPWWARKDMDRQVGAALIERWWRYTIARLGAYNVMWTLAGEYNMNGYGGLGLDFWKRLGAMIRREDPWQRLIGAHPTPPGWSGGAEAPQWSTGQVLHGEPWLSYNQSQAGHGRWRNEMIPLVVAADYARTPAKPVVVTEPWYEFIEGNPAAEDVRFGAWSAMLSGAAGHTYGGGHVWWAHVPESPANQGNWPLHREFDTDTLDYPGASGVGFMGRFLRGLEWWKLEPHPERVSEYPAKFCAAAPGARVRGVCALGRGPHARPRAVGRSRHFRVPLVRPDGEPGETQRDGQRRRGARVPVARRLSGAAAPQGLGAAR